MALHVHRPALTLKPMSMWHMDSVYTNQCSIMTFEVNRARLCMQISLQGIWLTHDVVTGGL